LQHKLHITYTRESLYNLPLSLKDQVHVFSGELQYFSLPSSFIVIIGSVNLATDRPYSRFYILVKPLATSLARERYRNVMPFSNATKRA